MSAPLPARSKLRSGASRRWLWLLAGGLTAAVLISLGFKMWVDRYLRSPEFRTLVATRAGETLKAQTELSPLTLSGRSFYADAFRAEGTEASAFASLRLEQIRADVSA